MLFPETKIICSLFDYSGNWSEPYLRAGYDVRRIDIKNGDDVRLLEIPKQQIYGVLAAPVCTAFTTSGAQYWKEKDEDGRTLQGLELIGATCRFILASKPTGFWVIENPVGRLNRWLGKPKFYFNPCDFGDPYTKKTALWGEFNIPTELNKVEPVFIIGKNGKRLSPVMWNTGGGGEKTKEKRSETPKGFSEAFFKANQ